ncbi:MAG: AAA family ATPase [bacterium]|nr:AAA family ATPase [bacterium]
MLDHMKVTGFKSIEKMNLKLGRLNILIGGNGAGKSNCISLFRLINRIVEGKLQLYIAQAGGMDTLLRFGRKHTGKISVKLDFGSDTYRFSLLPTQENTLVLDEEQCLVHQGDGFDRPYDLELGTGHKESRLPSEAKKAPGNAVDHILRKIGSWKNHHFHDTGDTSKMKGSCNINDNRALNHDASNLAAFLYYLREVHHQYYENIVDTIRLAAPFFDDFQLRPNPLNKELIQLEWREKKSEAYFNAHSLSDGSLRFICLVTLLMQPHLPSTILLDEPELGLHPYAVSLLADLLKSVSQSTQVIASTQSVTLVNQFTPGDIIVVDREAGQSVFKHLSEGDIKNWLDEYGIGDLWEKNILGGRPAYE